MLIDSCLSHADYTDNEILTFRKKRIKTVVDCFVICEAGKDRDSIIEVCKDFSDDDIFMLSDYNQIPSVAAIEFRKTNVLKYPMTCKSGTVMTTLGYAREVGTAHLRENRAFYSPFPL